MYKKIPYSNSRRYVSSYIEKLIINGTLKPGDKLPREDILAQKFGISRLTVRESLRELEKIGLIYTKRGSKGGSFIAQINSDIVADAFSLVLAYEKTTLKELLEARKVLECSIVKIAVLRASNEDIESLDKLNKQLESVLDNQSAFVEVHYKFHLQLALSSKNKVLITTLQSLRKLVQEYITIIPFTQENALIVSNEHKSIVDAIKKKNASLAEKLMEMHIDDFEKKAEKYLDKNI